MRCGLFEVYVHIHFSERRDLTRVSKFWFGRSLVFCVIFFFSESFDFSFILSSISFSSSLSNDAKRALVSYSIEYNAMLNHITTTRRYSEIHLLWFRTFCPLFTLSYLTLHFWQSCVCSKPKLKTNENYWIVLTL